MYVVARTAINQKVSIDMLPREDRKIAPSLLATYHAPDPSRTIATRISNDVRARFAAGEEEWLCYNRVHRIGLMNGGGFAISEMEDGRNLVQVVAEMKRVRIDWRWEGLVTIRVLKCQRHDDHLIPDMMEVTDEVKHVPLEEFSERLHGILWPGKTGKEANELSALAS